MRLSVGFKKYAKNTGYLFLEKIARIIFMLTVWAYMARYLGPEQFGLFNYALSFVFLFQILADLGLESIVVRELVRDEQKEDVILGSAFILKFIGSFLAVFLLFCITGLLSMPWQTRVIILGISSRLIFFSFRVIDYYFQAKVLSKYTVYCLLTALLVTSILSVVLISLRSPLFYFVLVVVAESAMTSLGLWMMYRFKDGHVFSWKVKFQEAYRLLKDSWPLIVTGAAIAVYMRIDQIILKELLGAAAVGYYSSAVRISEAFYFIPMVLASSLFPAIVSARAQDVQLYQERIKKLFSLLFWISFFIAICVSLCSRLLVTIVYGSQYLPAADVLSIHIWASVFVFLGVGAGKWMINENLQIYSMFYAIIGAVTNVVLNFTIIPQYGIKGTALVTVISYFTVVILSNLLSKRTRGLFFLELGALKIRNIFRSYIH